MHDILAAGSEFIVWLQQFQTPTLTAIFEFITNLGGSKYLFLIPFVLWCVDYRSGLRLLAVFALSLFVNTTLKTWIAQPRPFQFDARVISRGEIGYGLPSGHAQLVVVFWGVIASWVARPWFWTLAVVMMGLIGFSRIYLGVHFPSDVLAGWALGAVSLWAFIAYGTRIEAAWKRRGTGIRLALSLCLGAALFAFDRLFVNDAEHLNTGTAGFIVGLGVGITLGRKLLAFDGHGPWWQRAIRYLVGMALMLPMIRVMQWFGAPTGLLGELVIAFDLALLALFQTLAAPWLFGKIRLSSAEPV